MPDDYEDEPPYDYEWAEDDDFTWIRGFGEYDWDEHWRYIGKADKVIIPHEIHGEEITSYKGMFFGTSVSGVYSDNPNITDMSRMFDGSTSTSLDLTHLDTSGVTDMSLMLSDTQATTLDLSNFNTSKVTNMSGMFHGAQATTLNLTSFDTRRVTNMINMFYNSNAKILDLSSFDTSNLPNMSYMNSMFTNSKAKEGYARTKEDVDRFNASEPRTSRLKFIVKPKTN